MAMMGKVRSMHFRQGKSISEIARLTSLSRNTIKKWLKAPQHVSPPCRTGHLKDVSAKAAAQRVAPVG